MSDGTLNVMEGTVPIRRREADSAARKREERVRIARMVCGVTLGVGLLVLGSVPILQPPPWLIGQFFGTASSLLIAALAGLGIASLVRLKWPVWYTVLGMGVVIVGLLTALVAIWMSAARSMRVGAVSESLVLSALLGAMHYALLGAAARSASGRRPKGPVIVLIIMVFASAVVSISCQWVFDPPHALIETSQIGAILATLSAHALIIRVRGQPRMIASAGAAAILFCWASGAFFGYLIVDEPMLSQELTLRVCSSLLAGALILTIANVWMATHQRRRLAGERGEKWPYVFAFRCPACQTAFEATTGRCECPSCAIGVRVSLDPGRCLHCGYSLGGLSSPTCPECGAIY